MDIRIGKKAVLLIMFTYLLIKCFGKFDNGTFVWYLMRMGNRVFIIRLGKQYTASMRIKRIPENIEQKVTLSHKTDRKGVHIFRFGGNAICTTTLKIQYVIKSGLI